MKASLERLLRLAADPETAARCRAAAEEHFSLEKGIRAYARIYEEL